MRELKTLEVDKWVPSEKKGMVKHAGLISPVEAFESLKKHLEKENLLPDEYFLPCWNEYDNRKSLPNYSQAMCYVNFGSSEGIYLYIALMYRDDNHRPQIFNFATGKTLGETGDDYLRMSRISAECSMMLNGRGAVVRFYEDERNQSDNQLVNKNDEENIEKLFLDEQIVAAQESADSYNLNKESMKNKDLNNER